MSVTEYTYAPYRFQHASAVCALKEPAKNHGSQKSGALVAFYAGLSECHESQHVCLAFNGEVFHELEPYTGNPVLFSTSETEAVLIYSKFEDLPANRIRWWQYCSLWARKISTLDDGVLCVSDPEQIIVEMEDLPTGKGLLTRCHPVKTEIPGFTEEKWCLPVYREHDPTHHGALLISDDGFKWETHSLIGHDSTSNRGLPIRSIQPTFWKQNGELHALLRNFNYSSKGPRLAYHSRLDADGKWKPLVESTLYNANNSLVVLPHNDRSFVLWNHDPKGRNNLFLGVLNTHGTGVPNGGVIAKVSDYGHYPSMAVIEGKLHILFTTSIAHVDSFTAKSCIKHRIFDLDSMEMFLKAKGF
tara:strand:- start:74674 stop:75747 length:1074 start_codon:yes stop_codon:yes gene_type:complete